MGIDIALNFSFNFGDNMNNLNKKLLAFLLLILSANAYANQNATNKYARSSPFTVDYSKGRTKKTSYASDVNKTQVSETEIERICTASKNFDFNTQGFSESISSYYFSEPKFDDFEVITIVSVPLQKIFVLDRNKFKKNGRDGLVYAWRTSTGYHDFHYAIDRKSQQLVYGQKSAVQIYHQSRPAAVQKLKSLASGNKDAISMIDTENPQIRYSSSATKKVEYAVGTTKVNKQKALDLGLEILGEDNNNSNLALVRRHALSYTDYFHTETGYYIMQNGFSSRHISGESDSALDTEEPYMPWALFFNLKRGMATHGAMYRGTLGSTGSHGCVRLLEENACRLFHKVGQTEKTELNSINEKTGTRGNSKISAHRALFIVSGELNRVEQHYFELLRQ
jgi:lipoprotein-anchoring transpeptidase ErfK/SrfK